ncbi:MAG: 50S ribosomal protein L13 [Lewinella sp.]|nr:50S ribosomal protein L13 [Lewinella sp.]
MNTLSYKTKVATPSTVEHKWYIIDAEGEVIGRMCTRIASVLRGKHKPDFTTHFDNGDYVIVINADKARFTGLKMDQKEYITYSNHPGGQKRTKAKDMLVKKPTALIENAVRGMLPKTRLGRAQIKKLYVYAGAEHPHQAQKPEKLEL